MISKLSLILIIAFSLVGVFVIWTIKRMIPILKNYRKLGKEEFMKRFNQGISNVTPIQQARAGLSGHPFILMGIIIGIFVSFKTKTYWLILILVGSLILEIIGYFGAYQKYIFMKKQDKIMKEMIANAEKPEEIKDVS